MSRTKEKKSKKIETIPVGEHQSVEVQRLVTGDTLRATLKDAQGAEKVLIFTVCKSAQETGRMYPVCTMQWENDPRVSPEFELEGTGRWTTRRENPVQKQDTALSISYGHISVGGHITLFVDVPGEARQRQVIDMHGVVVSKLKVVR